MPKWQLVFYHLETSKASINRGETKRTNPTNQISPLPHRTEVEICHGRLLRENFQDSNHHRKIETLPFGIMKNDKRK